MKTVALSLLLCFIALLATPTPALAQTHSAALTWSWSQGTGDAATGFKVKRANASGGPYTIIQTTTGITSMAYTDLTVSGGSTYYYVVTAYNATAESPNSNEFSAVIPISAPVAPSGLTGVVK